jgi:monoamine oxidase
MSIQTIDTLIVGGGLSGIYAGFLLSQKRIPYLILEARDRIGGRILSPAYLGFYADLGPSWYWPAIHPKMTQLVETLGLSGYRQFEDGLGRFQRYDGTVQTVRGYATEPPSFRICGGMAALIKRLCTGIDQGTLLVNHPVCRIDKMQADVLVSVGELERVPWAQFKARNVILALPPRLAAASIWFTPELPPELTQAMLRIGTWMAGQAKFCAFYENPFWRRLGLSGQAFSECGPLNEIHDASNNGTGPYGLTGFVGLPAAQRNQQSRLTEAILAQLALIFGPPASQPAAFFYQDWAREPFTATEFDQAPMVEHPVYQPPAGRHAIWDDTIFFAGTETADRQGGYLEGAVCAAERAVMSLTAQ